MAGAGGAKAVFIRILNPTGKSCSYMARGKKPFPIFSFRVARNHRDKNALT
jgi:hypothetical protein